MMSRRRSLVGVVSRGTQRFLVFLCVAAMLSPSLAHAKRGKRMDARETATIAASSRPRPAELASSTDREHAAEGAFTERRSERRRGGRSGASCPRATTPPRGLRLRGRSGRARPRAPRRHARAHPAHEGRRAGGGLALAARGAGRLRPAAREAEARLHAALRPRHRASSSPCATRSTTQSLLTLERRPDGTVVGRREALPYFVEVKGVAGRIDHGLKLDSTAGRRPAGGGLGAGRHLRLGPRRRRRPPSRRRVPHHLREHVGGGRVGAVARARSSAPRS